MTGWQMYWILMLDNLCCAAAMAMILCGGIGAFLLAMGHGESNRKALMAGKIVLTIAAISVLLAIFVPSTKQMAAIIVVPKIVNSEQVQEMPENLIELANEWVKDKTESLKGTEHEETN